MINRPLKSSISIPILSELVDVYFSQGRPGFLGIRYSGVF